MMAKNASEARTVDAEEIERFSKLAASWWDEAGPMRPLHDINPLRMEYIRDHLTAAFDLDCTVAEPFEGMRILDLGCGGGIISEPLSRLGAELVAIDAAEDSVEVARLHAQDAGLVIDYRCTTAEALVEAGEVFDAIVSMEVLEHVADVGAFLMECGKLLRPGGAIALSTLNRTPKAYALGIALAEHVLHLLPVGTHDYGKFVKPGELNRYLRAADVELTDVTGMVLHPIARDWRFSRDKAVNYLAFGKKLGE
jgi:2-polyprenyl-6-hydroxyphenyl methylase / 3-demethylubiquinone-9 3-methyltransferase